jgi:hypothetical protein
MTKITYSNTALKELELLNPLPKEPNYCECARVLSRPLWEGEEPILHRLTSSFSGLEDRNLKVVHKHVFWQQSKDNIGFRGADGQLGLFSTVKSELFSESFEDKNYQDTDSECLDGSLLREAVIQLGKPKEYRLLGYNCQVYVKKLKDLYLELMNGPSPARTE